MAATTPASCRRALWREGFAPPAGRRGFSRSGRALPCLPVPGRNRCPAPARSAAKRVPLALGAAGTFHRGGNGATNPARLHHRPCPAGRSFSPFRRAGRCRLPGSGVMATTAGAPSDRPDRSWRPPVSSESGGRPKKGSRRSRVRVARPGRWQSRKGACGRRARRGEARTFVGPSVPRGATEPGRRPGGMGTAQRRVPSLSVGQGGAFALVRAVARQGPLGPEMGGDA